MNGSNYIITTALLVVLTATVACGDTTSDPYDHTGDQVVARTTEGALDCLLTSGFLQIGWASDVDLQLLVESRCNRIGAIDVMGGSSFTDLWFLSGIEEAIGTVDIEGDSLTSLHGMEQLQHIGFRLKIHSTDRLTSLKGLSALENINGRLSLQINYALRSLSGLEHLKSVGVLQIESNRALRSLGALSSLEHADEIIIRDNPNLPQCEAEKFAQRFEGISSKIKVEYNDTSATCDE